MLNLPSSCELLQCSQASLSAPAFASLAIAEARDLTDAESAVQNSRLLGLLGEGLRSASSMVLSEVEGTH